MLKFLQSQEGPSNEDLIAEMIQSVLKLAADNANRGDLKILNRSLRELRYAFKVFAPYRTRRKISVFGSTRVTGEQRYYKMAVRLGRCLAEKGFMVITGAGSGIMQAAHDGAGRENSFGVNILLPINQLPNQVIRDDPKLVTFRFFFTRKLMFVKEADAVVFFPGGFGTHDEAMESLTLAQTGKNQVVPIIFVDLPGEGYWQAWRTFLEEQMLDRGFISKQDLSLFRIHTDVEEVVREIQGFYRNYHSARFVNRHLVIRLQHPLKESVIGTINREFRDIMTEGEITPTAPLPEEADDPDTHHLYRILMPFNRRDFGRLRQMIDFLNEQALGPAGDGTQTRGRNGP